MKIIIVNNAKDAGEKAARLVIKEIKRKQNLVLGLATGKTMISFYKTLIRLINNRKIDISRIRTFNLDEYIGLSLNDRRSLRYYMDKNFFTKVDIKKEKIHFLDGKAKNKKRECARYEMKIKDAGGIDLQILGIGQDGHIGFNEPHSSFKSKTREVMLSEITRKNNAKFFGSADKVPRRALTMGIDTIMSAKKIILLAFGKNKAEIVARAVDGAVSEEVPASVLQKHKDIIFVLDKNAGSELEKG